MKLGLVILLAFGGLSASAVDLTAYPFKAVEAPESRSSVTAVEEAETKEIRTNHVRFLFVSFCDAAGDGPKYCIWAFVDTILKAKVTIERGPTPLSAKLYSTYLDRKAAGSFDDKVSKQFVSVMEFTPGMDLSGLNVNGKTIIAEEWIGQEKGPKIPMVWLPVTKENEARVAGEYYESYMSGKREVKLHLQDFTVKEADFGNAYYVIFGFEAGEPGKSNEYIIARKHPTEADTYTGKMTRALILKEGGVKQIDWKGYTFTTKGGLPVSIESLSLFTGIPE